MSFSRVIVRLKHQRAIGGEKRNCVIDRRTRDVVDTLFFSPQHIRSSHQYCNFPIPLPSNHLITASSCAVQIPRIYPIFPPSPLHRYQIPPPPLHNQPVLPPVPPLPNRFTSVSECVNTCKGFKKKKKKSSEFFEEEWWKKKWGKRRAKCDREDWFKENNRENVHTHTHIRRTV